MEANLINNNNKPILGDSLIKSDLSVAVKDKQQTIQFLYGTYEQITNNSEIPINEFYINEVRESNEVREKALNNKTTPFSAYLFFHSTSLYVKETFNLAIDVIKTNSENLRDKQIYLMVHTAVKFPIEMYICFGNQVDIIEQLNVHLYDNEHSTNQFGRGEDKPKKKYGDLVFDLQEKYDNKTFDFYDNAKIAINSSGMVSDLNTFLIEIKLLAEKPNDHILLDFWLFLYDVFIKVNGKFDRSDIMLCHIEIENDVIGLRVEKGAEFDSMVKHNSNQLYIIENNILKFRDLLYEKYVHYLKSARTKEDINFRVFGWKQDAIFTLEHKNDIFACCCYSFWYMSIKDSDYDLYNYLYVLNFIILLGALDWNTGDDDKDLTIDNDLLMTCEIKNNNDKIVFQKLDSEYHLNKKAIINKLLDECRNKKPEKQIEGKAEDNTKDNSKPEHENKGNAENKPEKQIEDKSEDEAKSKTEDEHENEGNSENKPEKQIEDKTEDEAKSKSKAEDENENKGSGIWWVVFALACLALIIYLFYNKKKKK